MSSAPGLGSRLSGTSRYPSTSAAPTTGTLIQNTAGQDRNSIITPPISGPRPTPTAAMAAQMLIAFPRSSRGKTSMMIESVAGMISAPPMPITARAAISCPPLAAKAPPTLASPNTSSPSWRACLRP